MDLLDKMATYVRVVESGSLSRAARQLRISPAAVSRQITMLEASLGVPLLLRSTRRMTVTAAGQRYYERCLLILRDVDEAQTVGRAIEGGLKVNAPVTFGLARVIPYMHSLMTKHPGLRVDLQLEDRIVDLVLENFDVAIRVGGTPPDSAELVAHPLFAFRRVLVAAPSYLRREGEPKTPEVLARHDVLTPIGGSGVDSWNLVAGDREARVSLKGTFRSNALHALKQLSVEGAGIALLPEWFVTEETATGSLRIVLPAWRTESLTVYALHRTAHRGAPRVRALVDHLRQAYGTRDPAQGRPR